MVPTLLSPASLTWDAFPSLEAELPSVSLLDWGGVHPAWHSALRLTLFKAYCLLRSGWDQSPEWDQGLEDLGGNRHPATTSPGAEVPNSSLLPENTPS